MVTEFQDKVYKAISKVPKGKVTTYKIVAEKLGINSSQAVGQALKCNPYAPKVPCHRVVASNGTIGGFAGKNKGPKIRDKIRLLENEGVKVEKNKIIGFEKVLWK
ncbi:MGMT family protein [Nanoarchaeota archaeon]